MVGSLLASHQVGRSWTRHCSPMALMSQHLGWALPWLEKWDECCHLLGFESPRQPGCCLLALLPLNTLPRKTTMAETPQPFPLLLSRMWWIQGICARVARTLLSVPRRSLFINIFLPPHLFNITYSAWKYCPFCPLLHHLLTQSSLCLGRIQLAHTGGERIRISRNCWFGEGQREGCETQKSPCAPIAPQLRSPSLPPAMVPRVINAQPSFHPGLPSPRPDVPAAVAGTMASAECPAQRQQLHSRVRLCSLLEQWQCVTPSRRPAPNNLFIDAISLSVVYLRMSFHKCMEIEIILCFPPKD